MALSAVLSFTPVVTQTSQLDLVTGIGIAKAFASINVTSGVGANQATNYVSDTRTLAAGAGETLDFSGGLVDTFGNVLFFTRIILLMVKCPASNVAPIMIDTVSGGFTAIGSNVRFNVPPGGCAAWGMRTAAALPLIAGTSDKIVFRNGSAINPGVYDIIAVGS